MLENIAKMKDPVVLVDVLDGLTSDESCVIMNRDTAEKNLQYEVNGKRCILELKTKQPSTGKIFSLKESAKELYETDFMEKFEIKIDEGIAYLLIYSLEDRINAKKEGNPIY
jgi:hypothetical protein